MLTLPSSVRIYMASEPVDLRRGFDGLSAATRHIIRAEPLSGHLFVFVNRRSNRLKVLLWQPSGCSLPHYSAQPGHTTERCGIEDCHAVERGRRIVRGAQQSVECGARHGTQRYEARDRQCVEKRCVQIRDLARSVGGIERFRRRCRRDRCPSLGR